ncbi:MAG: sensor domain-containing diguanylate cyclase [Desulfobulbus sp.]|jgi:diguanylate cyclase (GGDEF)-like protein|nr:sensor domain-containing diguanylate cyclase [Desulfobulbus sp.]
MTEQGTDWRLVAAEETRQRQKAEEALVEMRRFLFDYFHLLGPDPLENINVVVRTLGKVLGSDVALYNRLENGILKTWSIDHEPPGFKREDDPRGHICYDMTISHHGPTNIEAVVLNDLEGSEWETLDSNVKQYGLKAYLGFPVLVEGQVVGSLCVVDTRKRMYTDVEQYIIAAFSSAIRLEEERLLTQNRLAAAIADLKEKNEQIERMALTDLPNRRAMIRFLDREIATLRRRRHTAPDQAGGKGFALVLCDIDRFKAVNDTYGHVCGDEVLKSVATILLNNLRGQDLVARWGGEDFLLLLRDMDADEAVAITERIRQAIAATPFACGDESFQVTLTFGISCWNDPHTTIDYCVDCSDQALYAGKAGGRNRVVVLPAQTLSL